MPISRPTETQTVNALPESPAARPPITVPSKKRLKTDYKMSHINTSVARQLHKLPPKKYVTATRGPPEDHFHLVQKTQKHASKSSL